MSLAMSQIDKIDQLCDFIDSPGVKAVVASSVPVSMPPDVGSLGFDTRLWVGLGIVGLWSALDAIAERANLARAKCKTCGRYCLPTCMMNTGKINAAPGAALDELEDVRNLFAHNFAGQTDAVYFDPKRKRHVLASGTPVSLSSGARFDGTYLVLNTTHLRYYAEQSRQIARTFL
jgi:hypothetical protein